MDPFPVYIGYDSREDRAYSVCYYSLVRLAKGYPLEVRPLKHKGLRQLGYFTRPWSVDASTGQMIDERDGKPFSTEFAFTRFLVPFLQHYKGWALFQDCDMVWRANIKDLIALCDDRYAVMCVKHNHIPLNKRKMDNQEQSRYYRKNWSSFVLFNCGHPSNRRLTLDAVNSWPGSALHSFSWLRDEEIGDLHEDWNFLVGHSHGKMNHFPKVLHFTDGGPWFEECKNVPYAKVWEQEWEGFERDQKEEDTAA